MLHTMTDEQLVERLRTLNGTPRVLLDNPELLQTFLPTLRADFSTVETYTYRAEEPLACGISALGGTLDPDVPAVVVEAWREQTRGRFSFRLCPGDHFFLLQPGGRRDLLDRIVDDLDPLLTSGR
jgi:surfactin synthase thioesterase subunit